MAEGCSERVSKNSKSVPSRRMVKFISHYVDTVAVTSVTSVAPITLHNLRPDSKGSLVFTLVCTRIPGIGCSREPTVKE